MNKSNDFFAIGVDLTSENRFHHPLTGGVIMPPVISKNVVFLIGFKIGSCGHNGNPSNETYFMDLPKMSYFIFLGFARFGNPMSRRAKKPGE